MLLHIGDAKVLAAALNGIMRFRDSPTVSPIAWRYRSCAA